MVGRTIENMQSVQTSGWDYLVHRRDGSIIMYTDHDEVAEWIKADIDAGHTVSRISSVTTK